MPTHTNIRWAAVAVLALVCLALLVFEIQAVRGRLIGNELLGELFVLVIRQDGGIIDFVKQAVLPIITGFTVFSKPSPNRDLATNWLWGFLVLYLILTLVFFFEFQTRSIAEEIWVNETRETFIRDPDDVAANQEAFEGAIRFFCYQSGVAIATYALVLLGFQPKDRPPEGGAP